MSALFAENLSQKKPLKSSIDEILRFYEVEISKIMNNSKHCTPKV